MGDGLPANGILLIVEGEENLGGPAEILGRSIHREEEVPDEEHEIHEEPELDCPAVAGALRAFAGSQAEVQANGDQVGYVAGSGVGGGSFLVDDGLDDSEGDCLFLSDRGIFEAVALEFPCEALVEPSVCFGVSRFSGVRQTIQEVGRCNCPPCLRNRFFPKLFQMTFGVLGVPDLVAVDLEKVDARDGWILESRIDQQGGTEVGPLPV